MPDRGKTDLFVANHCKAGTNAGLLGRISDDLIARTKLMNAWKKDASL